MTLDQVKHVFRELGWREDDRNKVDVFLHYRTGSWTTGPTSVEEGLVRVEDTHGPKWIEPSEITSISKGIASRLDAVAK
jgi:hypothetical protein